MCHFRTYLYHTVIDFIKLGFMAFIPCILGFRCSLSLVSVLALTKTCNLSQIHNLSIKLNLSGCLELTVFCDKSVFFYHQRNNLFIKCLHLAFIEFEECFRNYIIQIFLEGYVVTDLSHTIFNHFILWTCFIPIGSFLIIEFIGGINGMADGAKNVHCDDMDSFLIQLFKQFQEISLVVSLFHFIQNRIHSA